MCVKLLQNSSVPNFSFTIHTSIIIRSINFNQTFVLRPSCCLSFCKQWTMTNVLLLPTLYCHSEFQYLQVSISRISNVRVSSIFLLQSVENYNLKLRCALKHIMIFILRFMKTVRIVQMYKFKRQANNGTSTLW
jgi:hypothetical protein